MEQLSLTPDMCQAVCGDVDAYNSVDTSETDAFQKNSNPPEDIPTIPRIGRLSEDERAEMDVFAERLETVSDWTVFDDQRFRELIVRVERSDKGTLGKVRAAARQAAPGTLQALNHTLREAKEERSAAERAAAKRALSEPLSKGVDDTLKNRLRHVRDQAANLGGAPNPADVGRAIYQWFKDKQKARFYVDGTGEPFMCFGSEVYYLDSPLKHRERKFWTLIHDETGMLRGEHASRLCIEAFVRIATLRGYPIDELSWLHTVKDPKNPRLYINLNNDRNEIVRIDAEGVTVLPNGDNPDNVLLAPSDQMKGVRYNPDIDMAEARQALESLFSRPMACSPEDRLVIRLWLMAGPLRDYASAIPTLRAEGSYESGKTQVTKLLTCLWLGHANQKTMTPAALWSEGSRNPLTSYDNLEPRAIGDRDSDLHQYFLVSATKGARTKRKDGTDSETVTERQVGLTVTNGIAPIGGGKGEITSRTFTVECSRVHWDRGGAFDETITLDALLKRRDDLMSYIFKTLSGVLRLMRDHDGERRAKRLLREVMSNYDPESGRNHSKHRLSPYLSMMYLVFLTEQPAEQDDRLDSLHFDFVHWLNQQDDAALESDAEDNPIAQALHALFDAWEQCATSKDPNARGDFVKRYGVDLDWTGTIRDARLGTILNALNKMARDRGGNLGVRSVEKLRARLKSDEAAIERAGFKVTFSRDQSLKVNVYTIKRVGS